MASGTHTPAGGAGTPPPTAAEIAAEYAKIAVATPPPPPEVNENDPVELLLTRNLDASTGEYSVFTRVLNIAGKGLENQVVVFTIEGRQEPVTTDNQGDAKYPYPLAAPTDGKELIVSAHCSGIRAPCSIRIFKRTPKTPEQVRRDGENNKRARIFLLVTAVLLVGYLALVYFFGLGKPLFNPGKTSIMPKVQTQLSEQQEFFNDLPGVRGTKDEFKIPKPPLSTVPTGKWQKPLSLVIFLWTIFSVGYAIASLREEVWDAVKRGVERVVDKRANTANAKDPLFERLVAFTGHLASARRQLSPTAEAERAKMTPPVTGKNTFWERLQTSLLSDITVEVLPAIVKAIRGK